MRKVSQYIVENNLLKEKDKVLVAISGGPDSVCLLNILSELKEQFHISIGAIHINHMLRGDEALRDEEYTKEMCEKLNVDYYCERIDINKIARERGISLELAGREERYRAFYEVKERYGYTKIAVAHNANDQAETVLMRIMRGTGLEGLTGIKAKRDEVIVRPILCLSREEIEEYCEQNNLNARIDMSNYETVYNRNKVRLEILPYMQKNFNEDIVYTLNRMVMLLQKDNEFIDGEVKKAYDKYCLEENGALVISKALFKNEKEAIITRIIIMSIKRFSDKHQNFEMKHIYEVIELEKKQVGKEIHLTNNIVVKNSYEKIFFINRNDKKTTNNVNELFIKKNDIPTKVEFLGRGINFELIHIKNTIEFSNNDLIKYFDYDKIEEGILVRTRKNGDKIVPIGMKGSKKLKDIFIDLKIPREFRDEIPIICFDEEISWIGGYKVSELFKVTRNTNKVIKISLE